MSSANVEICANCGRLLRSSEQAYVVRGKIVCAECDRVLRSEQAPQPAPSPEPLPEIRKGITKSEMHKFTPAFYSLKKRAIFVGLATLVVAIWLVHYLASPKYKVEEKLRATRWFNDTWYGLEVTVSGSPRDLKVVLFSPNGGFVERTIRELSMEMTGSTTVYLPFSEFSLKDSSPESDTEKNYTKAGYRLTVWKTKNGVRGAKVYDKTISFVSRGGNLSIANPGQAKKDNREVNGRGNQSQSSITSEPVSSEGEATTTVPSDSNLIFTF